MINLKKIWTAIRASQDRSVRSLSRGILLAAMVGVVAGLGAVAFEASASLVEKYILDYGSGYAATGAANSAQMPMAKKKPPEEAEASTNRDLVPWMLVLVPAGGGLVSGLLIYYIAIEAEGHGTDAAIKAYHHERSVIPLRVPIVKIVASAITLGTGGSGGREGPIAQVGAGFGSYLGTKLHMSESERGVLTLAGLGAGIGAIFHAPLAGAIFGIEVIYQDPDFESEALIPAFIATAVSYTVFSLIFGLGGFHPLFNVGVDLTAVSPYHLMGPLALMAILMAGVSAIYVKIFYAVHDYSHHTPIPFWLRPAIGAALTGALALGIYYGLGAIPATAPHQYDGLGVLAYGYGFLQKVLGGTLAPTYGTLIILAAVAVGKIITTSLTISTGGSGGVFGPSMVIGASSGTIVGILFHMVVPDFVSVHDIVIFSILGMASFFSACANTPVSTLVMVFELTNSYTLLLPSMWVCALAYLVKGQWKLYREQVPSRLDSPAHRGDFIVDILKGLAVRNTITDVQRDFRTVELHTPLSDISKMMTNCLQSSFPVLDKDGNYYGLFGINDIRQFLYDSDLGPLAVAQDLAVVDEQPLTLEMDLSSALSRFAQGRFDELPVVDQEQPGRIVALLRRRDVVSVYDKRLLEMRAA